MSITIGIQHPSDKVTIVESTETLPLHFAFVFSHCDPYGFT